MDGQLGVQLAQLLVAGRRDQAVALSARALAGQPEDAASRLLHAQVLIAAGYTAEATQLLDATALPVGVPAAAWLQRAGCERALGRDLLALSCLEQALSQAPALFRARFEYAELLDAGGRSEQAAAQYFRSIFDAQQRGRWLDDATTPPELRARVRSAMDRVDLSRQALFERALLPHVEAYGEQAMRRVRHALGVYLGVEAAPPLPPGQRPKFFWMPDLPPAPYFNRRLLPWYEVLERGHATIQRECLDVLGNTRALEPFLGDAVPDGCLTGNGEAQPRWDAFFFSRHGEPNEPNRAACPDTAAVLDALPLARIEGHAPEVLFSVLSPGAHITPHHGVTNTRIVTHLPLVIPEGDCRLVVNGESYAWQEGRCVSFDDTFVHEAWNRTTERRVVLILDTWNPYLRPEECFALKDLVEAIGRFNRTAGVG